MKQGRERYICGIVHRASQQASDRNKNLIRRYASVSSAFMRMTSFMVENSFVGDVCEITHFNSGMQLGTIKVSAVGSLKMQFNLEGN